MLRRRAGIYRPGPRQGAIDPARGGGLSARHRLGGVRQAVEGPALSLPAGRRHCSPPRPAARWWPTTWGWAKRSRPSPPSRSWPAPPASSGCWLSRPTSLKHQWQQEIEKFTGRPALVVEGMLARRAELYGEPSFYKITNYDVISRDLEAIRRWQPDVVILDEAQRIKNWKTRTAQTVKQLESKHAIVLTGTPLENRLEELHSIVEFVDRFHLGPLFRFLDGHQHVDEDGRVVGYRDLSSISKTLEPILIRRTKDKVLQELPERLEKRFFVPMTEPQMNYHEENRETVARLVAEMAEAPVPGRGRPVADADRAAKHADVLRQHLPVGPADRPRREKRRADRFAGRSVRGPGGQGGGFQPVGADARAGRPPAGRSGNGSTSSSTAACRAPTGSTSSTASARTRPAACSWPPTPAAWA